MEALPAKTTASVFNKGESMARDDSDDLQTTSGGVHYAMQQTLGLCYYSREYGQMTAGAKKRWPCLNTIRGGRGQGREGLTIPLCVSAIPLVLLGKAGRREAFLSFVDGRTASIATLRLTLPTLASQFA